MKAEDWRSYKTFLKKSRKEFSTYGRTKNIKSLAQAGEKLWNAFQLLVQEKVGKRIRSYYQLKKAVGELYAKTGSELLLRTMKKVYDLHVFFYRGYTEDIVDVENDYMEAYEGMLILQKSLRIKKVR